MAPPSIVESPTHHDGVLTVSPLRHDNNIVALQPALAVSNSPCSISSLLVEEMEIRNSVTAAKIASKSIVGIGMASCSNNNNSEEQCNLVRSVQSLQSRATRMEEYAREAQSTDSAISQACLLSLQTRVPQILHQTEQLIHHQCSNGSGGEDVPRLVISRLRSTFALVRAMQYLDRIEEGMDPTSSEDLNNELRSVLDGLDGADSLPEEFRKDLAFRVSPWVPSVLCFDLPLGPSARTSILPGQQQVNASSIGQQLPINVEVEPVVEFRAHDPASTNYAYWAAHACQLTIENCTHKTCEFGSGAGMIGTATIRVRVSPFDASGKEENRMVWGKDTEEPDNRLQIKEARAIQTNAFPPKSKSTVDLYTSYMYGDVVVTVTMVIKTCMTSDSNEIPNLHVELFMAPPQQPDL